MYLFSPQTVHWEFIWFHWWRCIHGFATSWISVRIYSFFSLKIEVFRCAVSLLYMNQLKGGNKHHHIHTFMFQAHKRRCLNSRSQVNSNCWIATASNHWEKAGLIVNIWTPEIKSGPNYITEQVKTSIQFRYLCEWARLIQFWVGFLLSFPDLLKITKLHRYPQMHSGAWKDCYTCEYDLRPSVIPLWKI